MFKSKNPEKRAKAIVDAVANFNKPDIIADISKNLGDAMVGIEIKFFLIPGAYNAFLRVTIPPFAAVSSISPIPTI